MSETRSLTYGGNTFNQAFCLRAGMDAGDGIHDVNTGKIVNAARIRAKLVALGLLS